MKHVRLMLVVIVSAFLVCPAPGAFAKKKVSAPFEYSGYSSPEYTGIERVAEYFTTSDGTKLATVRYCPTGGPSTGPFPVIFTYFPYHYDVMDMATGQTKPAFLQEAVDFYTSYGYTWVVADMRGSGASYGTRVNFSEQLADDGKELVDWMAAQPWCDGNVGMIGASYMGWSPYAVAGRQPAALKCIIPEYFGFEGYTLTGQYPGGIRSRMGLFGLWGPVFFDMNVYWPHLIHGIFFPASPMVDEDGDGELIDEIPLDLNGNGFFHDDYQLPGNPPQYSDGVAREHVYYLMTMAHADNPFLLDQDLGFRDSQVVPDSDMTFVNIVSSDYANQIAESGIPIYHMGGWWDRYVRGTTQWFATLEKTNPSRLAIAPAIHNWAGFITKSYGPYVEYFGDDTEKMIQGFHVERLRFLDRYLKGIKNKVEHEPSVLIYVMNGEGWRAETEWPLKRTKMTPLYFTAGNSLSARKSADGADAYKADFTHDSKQDSSNANRWGGELSSVHMRTAEDAQCLTYDGVPLENDVEVTGHPVVNLSVSSTADYGDFYAYLVDVDENGNAFHVTDGQLRAGFNTLVPNEDIMPYDAGLDVLPDLPWHGFKQTDYTDGILADGNIVDLTFDLFPTSWVFKKGHRIRVSIACADYPTFALHPKLAPTNNPSDPTNVLPTIAVHRGEAHPSRIELPLIPPKHQVGIGN